MNDRYKSRHARVVWSGIALVLAAGVAVVVHVPAAIGSYIARINSDNSISTDAYFTCTAAATDPATRATSSWPLDETTGTTARDVSGNNAGATYTSAGVTYGVTAAVCPRDNARGVSLNPTNKGYLVANTAITTAANSTEEIWFKTTSKYGVLMSLGSTRSLTGATSTTYDRALFITTTGRLSFGMVYGNNNTFSLQSAAVVTDGAWHHAAVTFASANGGIALYLDGTLSKSYNSTSWASITAYLYAGYGTVNSGWNSADTTNRYFNGTIAFASYYPAALNSGLIAAHYRAGH